MNRPLPLAELEQWPRSCAWPPVCPTRATAIMRGGTGKRALRILPPRGISGAAMIVAAKQFGVRLAPNCCHSRSTLMTS